MTQSNGAYEFGAVCLGAVGITASWRRQIPGSGRRNSPMLVINVCDSTDDGVHTPALSVTVGSVSGLLALRSAIDAALLYDMPDHADPQGI